MMGMQILGKTVCQYISESILKIFTLFNPVILTIYLKKMKRYVYTNLCINMFTR